MIDASQRTVKGVVWARGRDGVYRLGAGGAVTFLGRPTLRRIGEAWVNFDNPEAATLHPETTETPSPHHVLIVAPRQ